MEALHDRYDSLGHMLRGTASDRPEKRCISLRGQGVTYGQMEGLSNQFANAFRRAGVGEGERIGLYCINSPWFMAAYFGIVKLGASVVPINLLLSPAEIEYILTDSEASGLVYFDQFEENLAPLEQTLSRMKSLVALGRKGVFEAVEVAEIAKGESPQFEIPYFDQDEALASIIYTSGTTGRPKGAMLTHKNLLFNVNSVIHALPVSDADIFLTVLPMFHSFGATVGMLTPASIGATIAAVPRFTPDEVSETIASEKATVFMGVPSMYTIFANVREEKKPDFSSLRFCVSGGAALPVEVMQRFEEQYAVPVLEGDGPTECSPVTSVNPHDGERKPGSIGIPVPGVSMKIMDEEGRELRRNEVGEIVVKGDNVMKGYLNLPEETRDAFFGDWYRTGDMGYEDDEGYFYIVDRKKDMIIVNGMNVYPRMIEEVLYSHPAVAEAAVVAEPHRLHGEVPKAFVVLREGSESSREELRQLCQSRLGRHEVPRLFEFVDELPKTPTGKILKRALVRKGEVERGVDLK